MKIEHLRHWLYFRAMVGITQRRFGDLDRRTCEFMGVLLVVNTSDGNWMTVEELVVGAESTASPRTIRRYLKEFIKRGLAVCDQSQRLSRFQSTPTLDFMMNELVRINQEWTRFVTSIPFTDT